MKSMLLSALLANIVLAQNDTRSTKENCANPSTLWEKHYCSITQNPAKYQELCFPYRYFPSDNGVAPQSYSDLKNVKGVVVFYHGFTACPNHQETSARHMQKLGYITLTPLIIGQGLKRGYNCDKPNTCVGVTNDNPTEMPDSYPPYEQFSKDVLDIVNQEISLIPESARAPGFTVSAVGLSFGGAMILHAASLPNNPYSKILAVNAHLMSSFPDLDYQITLCNQSPNASKCIADILVKTTSTPPGVNATAPTDFKQIVQATTANVGNAVAAGTIGPILTNSLDQFYNTLWEGLTAIIETPKIYANNLFDTPYGWGETCAADPLKGGYCNFRVRHLMGIHHYGEFATSRIRKIPSTVKFGNINVDSDGIARDAISVAMTNQIESQGSPVHRCVFPLACSAAEYLANNTAFRCGAPHPTFFMEGGVKMYWLDNLLENVGNFIESDTLGVAPPGSNAVCVQKRAALGDGTSRPDNIGPLYFKKSFAHFP